MAYAPIMFSPYTYTAFVPLFELVTNKYES